MGKSRILVVDDEAIMRSSLTDWLMEDGYDVMAVADGYTAIDKVKSEEWDLAVVDLKMPKIDGLEVLKRLHKLKPGLPVIIVTAYATVDTAVMAMKSGAADYVVKPFNPEEISLIIKKLVEHQRLIKENVRLRRALTKRFKVHDLIGKSTKMLQVIEMIRTVAPTKSTVMITGESGTGKELVARAIHELSPRKKHPFIATACGAIPESLLSAELFGYEKGAFTGAVAQHKGRIEMANKGTLFLDEIGDVSQQTQVDLLRFLQEREFRRIAGKELIRVDVRILVATNKDIDDMVARGEFREDLYYRLNVITITAPPLRERKEDIPILAEHFLEKYSLETGKKVESISDATMKYFMEYNWPGNVRQLENTIEHAVVVAQGLEIQKHDLPQHMAIKPRKIKQHASLESLTQLEKQHIRNVLQSCNWNIKKSAQILGINRVTLYNKIKKLKLKKE
ncbi:Fis family transcriptional regulator [candidate division WOR_3 bacterium SM23_42]|uniref:Fis family transcriptional regulator n=1 Tax=candidate division WOR_3 bacterium SM23_42 TaxID=1703779 RepID=A0A0S8FWZ5_UNCW3|nr:MAG: Fis family transcriptional regulator [candidate division WOR_3 bacterium SM23_42]